MVLAFAVAGLMMIGNNVIGNDEGIPSLDPDDDWKDCCVAVWEDFRCKCNGKNYSFMKPKD